MLWILYSASGTLWPSPSQGGREREEVEKFSPVSGLWPRLQERAAVMRNEMEWLGTSTSQLSMAKAAAWLVLAKLCSFFVERSERVQESLGFTLCRWMGMKIGSAFCVLSSKWVMDVWGLLRLYYAKSHLGEGLHVISSLSPHFF